MIVEIKICAIISLAIFYVTALPMNSPTNNTKDENSLADIENPRYANLTDEEIDKINQAQSDLIFTEKQKAQMRHRNIAISANLWPGGVVPYDTDRNFWYLPQAKRMIQLAVDEYARYTCIKLIPRRRQDRNFLIFTASDRGCFSQFGMVGGPQRLQMSTYCNNYPQVILHEIMHALGFIHEQQRPDRDRYVQINYNNVNRNMAFNFDKVPLKDVRIFPYDYTSIMHYDAWAFSMNRQMSMTAKNQQYTRSMGWYRTFSQNDIQRINYYYRCGK